MPTKTITVQTQQQGLIDFTHQVVAIVQNSQVQEGLCTLFIPHTSASLLIQENADPSAKRDLEQWLNRLVPEGDALYTHRLEGADDMPAHIKSALTATQLSIPITKNRLVLGAWQGIYLWEHRTHHQHRSVIVHILKES
jgi:secondary thiamine-phosphate synthase enzyme